VHWLSIVDATDIWAIRPGHGLPPAAANFVVGSRLGDAMRRGTPARWDVL
jgi:sialic acid synthase SpsE